MQSRGDVKNMKTKISNKKESKHVFSKDYWKTRDTKRCDGNVQ